MTALIISVVFYFTMFIVFYRDANRSRAAYSNYMDAASYAKDDYPYFNVSIMRAKYQRTAHILYIALASFCVFMTVRSASELYNLFIVS